MDYFLVFFFCDTIWVFLVALLIPLCYATSLDWPCWLLTLVSLGVGCRWLRGPRLSGGLSKRGNKTLARTGCDWIKEGWLYSHRAIWKLTLGICYACCGSIRCLWLSVSVFQLDWIWKACGNQFCGLELILDCFSQINLLKLFFLTYVKLMYELRCHENCQISKFIMDLKINKVPFTYTPISNTNNTMHF